MSLFSAEYRSQWTSVWPRIEACYSRTWDHYSMQPHYHNRAEIMYVLKGSCVIHLYDYQTDESERELFIRRHWTERLRVGEYILLDRNVLHRLEVPDENYMLNLEFVLAEDPSAAICVGDLASASPEASWAGRRRNSRSCIRVE